MLPSGLINPECMNLIGPGAVVNIKAFYKELQISKPKGYKMLESGFSSQYVILSLISVGRIHFSLGSLPHSS